MPRLRTRRIFRISGGGSAAAGRGRPRSEAAPKADALARNLRRLNPSPRLSFTVCMILPPSLMPTRSTDGVFSLSVPNCAAPRSFSASDWRQANAGAHLLPEAGASDERTLEAVRCSALLAGLRVGDQIPSCDKNILSAAVR